LWFDLGLVGLFITSTLLHLGEDINLLVMSQNQTQLYQEQQTKNHLQNQRKQTTIDKKQQQVLATINNSNLGFDQLSSDEICLVVYPYIYQVQ
jgi:PPE-repeat protein